MKKLMITAGAVAIAAGAFATAPTVYDYKASVKHMYLKEMTIRDTSLAAPQTVHLYQKVQKTSSLTGFLVQDTQACLGGKVGVQANADVRAWDQRRNRAFLVVLNNSAMPAELRRPKILPAVLEAKYMDKAFNGQSYLTQGTLFVGGDLVQYNAINTPLANTRPYLMPFNLAANAYAAGVPAAAHAQSVEYTGAANTRKRQVAKAYYGDYLWTSAYLFGQYNGPQWSTDNWGQAEKKVIDGMPVFMRPRVTQFGVAEGYVDPTPTGNGHGYYHDTWMNHAGFGTGIAGTTSTAVCCGLSTTTATPVTLQTLSGNMKGGLFICSENGFYTGAETAAPYGVYRRGAMWEDQFWAQSVNTLVGDVFTWVAAQNAYFGATAVPANRDRFQMDIWTDGDVETFTTDVMSGTWSIRLNTTLRGVALTLSEICGTFRNIAVPAGTPTVTVRAVAAAGTTEGFVAGNAQDVVDFNAMLKGAARRLSSAVVFADGTEISARTGTADRFENLPMITPKFAVTYGLDGQHLYAAPAAINNATPANTVSVYNW